MKSFTKLSENYYSSDGIQMKIPMSKYGGECLNIPCVIYVYSRLLSYEEGDLKFVEAET